MIVRARSSQRPFRPRNGTSSLSACAPVVAPYKSHALPVQRQTLKLVLATTEASAAEAVAVVDLQQMFRCNRSWR